MASGAIGHSRGVGSSRFINDRTPNAPAELDYEKLKRLRPVGPVKATHNAQFDDLVLVAADAASATNLIFIRLPEVNPTNTGRQIYIKEASNSANLFKIMAPKGATINGFTETSVTFGLTAIHVIFDGANYWTL